MPHICADEVVAFMMLFPFLGVLAIKVKGWFM